MNIVRIAVIKLPR
jgi:hypothetical protein